MNIFAKIRVRIKIHRMYVLMRKRMNPNDVYASAMNIIKALHILPQDRKESLIDSCLKVLKYGG